VKIFTYIKNDSSRISRKNFKVLGGIPLWKHLIYNVSSLFEVFIDTDSQEVIDECNRDERLSGVTAYPRDQKLIDMENDPDNSLSPALLMVENFLSKFVDNDNEVIVLTHVTSPFLKPETIFSATKILEEGFGTVHSVTVKQDFAWLESFDNPINFNPNVVQRTQDLDKVYFSNGAFFIFTKKTFMKNMNRFGKNNFFYEIDKVEGLEIDTMEDLNFAKIVYRGIKDGSN
jgi:N-acylneuraminate cytidylyltransferase